MYKRIDIKYFLMDLWSRFPQQRINVIWKKKKKEKGRLHFQVKNIKPQCFLSECRLLSEINTNKIMKGNNLKQK